jgi:ketosteroid isomerase-like protein
MRDDTYEAFIRRVYKDFDTGDLDLLGTVMAQDVVWHEPGRGPFAGDYKGPAAVLGFLEQLKTRSGGTFGVEVLAVLSEPGRTVVLQRETASTVDRDLNTIVAVDYEIHQGKVTEVTVYHTDQYAFDEFWAGT